MKFHLKRGHPSLLKNCWTSRDWFAFLVLDVCSGSNGFKRTRYLKNQKIMTLAGFEIFQRTPTPFNEDIKDSGIRTNQALIRSWFCNNVSRHSKSGSTIRPHSRSGRSILGPKKSKKWPNQLQYLQFERTRTDQFTRSGKRRKSERSWSEEWMLSQDRNRFLVSREERLN